MRITGGILGGRSIRVPRRPIRPTQDKVRQALFSILGERIAGCAFLDLFAGSGAVGLEAWSRGARWVCWVESDRNVLACLRKNVEECGGGDFKVIGMDVRRFLRQGVASERFDIIFADPPYGSGGWRERLLRHIGDGEVLAAGGLFVMEEASVGDVAVPGGWQAADQRKYGETRLGFFTRSERENNPKQG